MAIVFSGTPGARGVYELSPAQQKLLDQVMDHDPKVALAIIDASKQAFREAEEVFNNKLMTANYQLTA